jgi:hypothetical protein
VPTGSCSSADTSIKRGRRAAGAVAATAAGALLVAAGGGTATAQSPGGGAVFVAKPEVTRVSCLRRCASGRRAQGGSTVKILGRHLAGVREVVFHGSYGRGDDVAVKVRSGSERRLHARVPAGAVTGPISLASRTVRSDRSRPLSILPPPPPAPNAELTPVPGAGDAGAPRIETGTSRTKVFYGMRRAVTFSYRISDVAASVSVELVRAGDGAVVKTWAPAAQPGVIQEVVWSGGLGSSAATPGRYSFRLMAQAPGGATARSAVPGELQRDAFDLYHHVFPIRGAHDYGGAGARFGSGRSGHSHQGHDVFASCGTRMVAARGGRVQYSGYHAAAGYYVVIDGAGTAVDYAYMHLAERSPFSTGDRVYTGQQIGAVGETGNARGCHLHFELWGAPGWYEGGSAFDPLPSLQSWDSWS